MATCSWRLMLIPVFLAACSVQPMLASRVPDVDLDPAPLCENDVVLHVPLRHARAEEVAELVKDIFSSGCLRGPDGRFLNTRVCDIQVRTHPASNSVVLVLERSQIDDSLELLARLDVPDSR